MLDFACFSTVQILKCTMANLSLGQAIKPFIIIPSLPLKYTGTIRVFKKSHEKRLNHAGYTRFCGVAFCMQTTVSTCVEQIKMMSLEPIKALEEGCICIIGIISIILQPVFHLQKVLKSSVLLNIILAISSLSYFKRTFSLISIYCRFLFFLTDFSI